jgi:hypothetical protein
VDQTLDETSKARIAAAIESHRKWLVPAEHPAIAT